jgi:hypothetical protein
MLGIVFVFIVAALPFIATAMMRDSKTTRGTLPNITRRRVCPLPRVPDAPAVAARLSPSTSHRRAA